MIELQDVHKGFEVKDKKTRKTFEPIGDTGVSLEEFFTRPAKEWFA